MQRISMPTASPASDYPQTHSPIPDLLWISRQQQQHPLTNLHPLKNTIRTNSNGVRYKFDGKQWRPLCESADGHECRNLAFRSSLCQKHFYKMHLHRRPYTKAGSKPMIPSMSGLASMPFKRHLSNLYEYQHSHAQHEHNGMYVDDDEDDDEDSIQLLENQNSATVQHERAEPKVETPSAMKFYAVNCDYEKPEIHHMKSTAISPNHRHNCIHNDTMLSHRSEHSSPTISRTNINESLRPGILSLTRTEERSLANELISQLPTDTSVIFAEQWTCRRAREIMMDNYSHQFPSIEINPDWFYDFLLRNPRVPIHFQNWFGSVKAIVPTSDILIDIKIWELGLVTRSILPSNAISSSSSSPQ